MEIVEIQYVVTLAEELHFGRAARRHYISAQPFGRHIQRIEREVGVRLFERTSRRVSVTPAGRRFVDRARAVLAQLDGLLEIAAHEPPAGEEALTASTVGAVGMVGVGASDRWS